MQGVPFDIASQTFMEKHGSEILPPDTKESVILDIDEDFFGCTKGSDPLTATGLNWTHIGQYRVTRQKRADNSITLYSQSCSSSNDFHVSFIYLYRLA